MSTFVVLLKKEIKGQLRGYVFLIVGALFLVFGLATPLLLKYMALLLPADDIAALLPKFTATDVAVEYLDTAGQIGLIAAILIAMGAVARERESGTAAMTLSKPVGPGAFIVAKLVALTLVFGTGIVVGALGCYLYTVILFGNVDVLGYLAANVVLGLYLLCCLSVTVMYSCFFKRQLAAGALALATLIGLTATAGLPAMRSFSPGGLWAWAKAIAAGAVPSTWGVLVAGVVLVAVTTVIGWLVFKSKEL